ncbi:hypothetical protein WDX82_004791 [Salmonella enterica]
MTQQPKKRSKVKLAALILFGFGGWGAAVITGMGLGAAKNEAIKDQNAAQVWKAKAGKAYTELLLVKAGKAEQVTIPSGSLLECVSTTDNPPKANCEGFILPPNDY